MSRCSSILASAALAACGAESVELTLSVPVDVYAPRERVVRVPVTIGGDATGTVRVELAGLPAGLRASPEDGAVGDTVEVLLSADAPAADGAVAGVQVIATATDAAAAEALTIEVGPPSGDLDPTFGDGGIVTISGAAGRFTQGRGLAWAPDGGLGIVGSHGEVAGSQAPHAMVARLDPRGGFVTEHAGDGVLETTLPGVARHLAFDARGRALALIWDTTGRSASLVRFLSDGSVDTSYQGGAVALETAPISRAHALLDADGSASVVLTRAAPVEHVVVRYDAAGVKDAAFGPPAPLAVPSAPVESIARDAHDRIVLVSNRAMVRLDAAGRVDATFGVAGAVELPAEVQAGAAVARIAMDGDAIIVVQSLTSIDDPAAIVARFREDGALDTSFADDGVTLLPGLSRASSTGAAVAVDNQGRIVVAARCHPDDGLRVTRSNRDGTAMDGTFGDQGGSVIVPFADFSSAWAVEVTDDDRVLVVGSVPTAGGSGAAVVFRLNR